MFSVSSPIATVQTVSITREHAITFEIVEGTLTNKSGLKYDPYCSFSFHNSKKSTKPLQQTLFPIWKEQFNLGSFVAEDVIEVSCFDKEEVLGSFKIKLGDFMKPGEHTKTLPLEPPPGKESRGKLTIKLHVNENLLNVPLSMRRATTSMVPEKEKEAQKKNHDDTESTDKAFVRRKLTGWLKLRPDKDKMEDRLRQMGVIVDEGGGTKMFGASLDAVMTRQKMAHPGITVPIFLHQLIEKLLNDPSTFDEAGLFRISGSAAVITKIKASVDAGQTVDLSNISRDDAASLLKEFIRQFPEPLFTWKLSDQWKAAGDVEDEALLITTMRGLLRKLPGHNRHVWHAVNSFLFKLSQKSDINKMTPENIGIVIGPNVLWERETRLPIMNMNYIVANLIRHFEEVFHDYDTWLEGSASDSKLRDSSGGQVAIPSLNSPLGGSKAKAIEDWSVNDVTKWLTDKGYGQYSDIFVKANIDGKALEKLTADHLLNDCQIHSLGHRKKIIFRRDDLFKTS